MLRSPSSASCPKARWAPPPPSLALYPASHPGSAWRGACALWPRGCTSSSPRLYGERGGAVSFGAPPPLARRPYSACALPPGLHLGIGRKRERETRTRPGLWCGEKLRLKRRGGEGSGTALSCNLSATLRREKEKGRRPGREWGLSSSDPDVRGAVWPDVLGVGSLLVAGHLGLWPFGPEFLGLTPRFSNIRVSAPKIEIFWTRVQSSVNLGLLFYRVSNIWGSGPRVHQYPGFIPHTFKYQVEPIPVEISGVQIPQSKPGTQQLSPSRGRTGPRGQIRLSPPPLQGRLPGPAPQEGRKPRKRWQGERPPCPSPSLAEPLEDLRRSRKRWGTIVTPTR